MKNGICGAAAPASVKPAGYVCELESGHAGWHAVTVGNRDQDGYYTTMTWNAPGLGVTSTAPIPALTTEQVIAELKRLAARRHADQFWTMDDGFELAEKIVALIDQLPEPPRPDVVLESACAYKNRTSVEPYPEGIRAALRRFCELQGLPPLPELEER